MTSPLPLLLLVLPACVFDPNGTDLANDAHRWDAMADSDAAPSDAGCEGLFLPSGVCYFNHCPDGYIWSHDEAQAQCVTLHAMLCSVTQVQEALVAGYIACCMGWTSTPCDGGFCGAYPYPTPSTSGCTMGINELCAAPEALEAANCCR
jgi:hypothetical protein